MAAHFWRVPSSQVRKGAAGSVIEDRGMLRSAATGSNGMFLFSEVGAGVQPLALIGMWYEVLNHLEKRAKSGIDNRILDLPDIYMGITYYKPGERFKGLFPVHDAALELTKGFTGLVTQGIGNLNSGIGHTVAEIGGGSADAVGIKKSLFSKKKKPKGPSLTTSEVYIKFHYLQEKGMSKVGTKKVGFTQLIPIIRESLSDMTGS